MQTAIQPQVLVDDATVEVRLSRDRDTEQDPRVIDAGRWAVLDLAMLGDTLRALR